MSGIHCLGEMALATALTRFGERYEGDSGCSHLMSEKGDWTAPMDTKVVAYNERDDFGPGEVNLLCLACNIKAAKDEWNCDFCTYRGTDVSGLTDRETHEEYMACALCREIDGVESQIDWLYDELSDNDELSDSSRVDIHREIEEAKVRRAQLHKTRDERQVKW